MGKISPYSKKSLKNFKKVLVKYHKIWYYKDTKRGIKKIKTLIIERNGVNYEKND
jgi:hypothetical protein